MTTRCFGTVGSVSAPVEETIVFSSMATPGSGATSEPVAMMMAFAVTSCAEPPSIGVIASVPGAVKRAAPFTQSILFFLKRNSTPRVFSPTTLSFRAIIWLRSSETPATLTPCCASACSASAYFSEDCSSALEGMQPILRQVPPRLARLSTQAVFIPSCAARMAATYPPGPLPMTMTS